MRPLYPEYPGLSFLLSPLPKEEHPSSLFLPDLPQIDEYFYPEKKIAKSTTRRQIETSLDLLSDSELKIIQGTIDGILNSRESKK